MIFTDSNLLTLFSSLMTWSSSVSFNLSKVDPSCKAPPTMLTIISIRSSRRKGFRALGFSWLSTQTHIQTDVWVWTSLDLTGTRTHIQTDVRRRTSLYLTRHTDAHTDRRSAEDKPLVDSSHRRTYRQTCLSKRLAYGRRSCTAESFYKMTHLSESQSTL